MAMAPIGNWLTIVSSVIARAKYTTKLPHLFGFFGDHLAAR
jgi:hypothetical protein